MFLHNWWYVAAWSHQVPSGERAARRILNEPIVLYRKKDGTISALEDRCCHRLAPLSRGRLEGDDLRCMYHGIKFAASGQCIEIPGQDRIPAGVAVRTYPVVEQDRWVWVWMGDAARADASLIPCALGHEDPNYIIDTGELFYDANYQLIHDNLLDLTHLGYVHENTLGRKNPEWGRAQPIVGPLPHGVRVARWIRNHTVPDYMLASPGMRIDQWSTYDFVVPGVFLLTTTLWPVGTADVHPHGPMDLEPLYTSVTSQAVTPISEKETIYRYSGGQPVKQGATEAAVRTQLASFGVAFLEDKAMIEAQQKVIDHSPERWMMTLGFDRSVAEFRRLIADLISTETSPDERRSVESPEPVTSMAAGK
jgi:phenylpropionate dioxygenase-like ring-hydroxylating dioxygenase large terminal subunit